MNKPLYAFEQIINRTVPEIEAIVFNIKEGNFKKNNLPFILSGRSACTIKRNDSIFTAAFEDGHKEYINIDKANHTLAIKGEWWYKAVYIFQQLDNLTSIKLHIYNVAEKYRWAAHFMALNKKKYKEDFKRFIDNITEHV